jgi:acetoin utilization deacetylase AcuC-like enzyme
MNQTEREAIVNTEHASTHVYYSPAYAAAGYSFDTTRKARWVAESLCERPIAGVVLVAPEPLTAAHLAAVHESTYVDAVRTGTPRALAESNGFEWDPGIWEAVCASNGGAVAAAVHALQTGRNSGSLSSGLHHAHRGCGAAFCTFNGLALAAKAALDAGAASLLVLDVDAHPGDGTVDIVSEWPGVWHADVTVCPWAVRPRDPSRCTSDIVRRAAQYLPTLERRLGALDAGAFDLCLYNAGMDPHEDSEVGGLPGITSAVLREREQMVFGWAAGARLPVAFVLAGGYAGPRLSRHALVDLHRSTIEAAAANVAAAGCHTPAG